MFNTTSLELLAQKQDKLEEERIESGVEFKKRLIEERASAIHSLIDAVGFEDPKVSSMVSKMAEWIYDDAEEIRYIETEIAQSDSKPLRRLVEGKQPDALTWKGSEQFRAIRAYWGAGITPWLRSPRPPRRRSI